MVDPKQIPDEVVWKLQDKLWRMGGASVDETRAALAAALAAWPGAGDEYPGDGTPCLILPLQEKSND
jgi:hypothetical protein